MGDSDAKPGSSSEQVVELGETYNHSKHGDVEVTGLWRGVEKVDKAHHTDEKDVLIVRFSSEIEGESVDELTETVDDFIEAIEEPNE